MKLSDLSDDQWLARLQRKLMHQRPGIGAWWQYYDGEQPLYYVAKILEEQSDRFPPLTINWSEKFVDMIDRRCVVEGFRLRGTDALDDDLWDIWQRNDMPLYESENNVASLVTGVSYGMVGLAEDGGALLTVEAPDTVAVEVDPLTRRTIAALKVWKSDPDSTTEDCATLILPSTDGGARIVTYQNEKPVGEEKARWMAKASKLQSSPQIPVVPFLNKQRQRRGRSVLHALKPVVDAANQVATNMMAGVEHHAVPRKYALGMRKEDFTDANGDPIPAWKIATGAVWISPYDEQAPEAKPEVGQFAATDLRNFHDTISLLARIGSGLCDLAPHTFGFGVSDNPASGDGIKEARVDFTSRVERVHVERGTGYERYMRLAMAVEGNDPSKAVRLETIWRDPSTPTKESQVKAAAESYTTGLADLRQARVDAGYSATTIKAMEERELAAAREGDPYVNRLGAKGEESTGASTAQPAE